MNFMNLRRVPPWKRFIFGLFEAGMLGLLFYMNSKPTSLLPYLTRRLLAEFKVGYEYEGPFLRVSLPRLQGVENYLQCY